jgi:quinol monooxygenase YgiN
VNVKVKENVMTTRGKPVLTHVTYLPKKGKEQELLELIKKHWPTLRKAGLATEELPQIYQARDKDSGSVYFIEIFAWADENAASVAHQTPEVMAVWEPMGNVMESRNDKGSPIAIAEIEKIPL